MRNLLKRLTSQLASKGIKNAEGMAASLLEKRGQLRNGKLTAKGKARQALGAAGRAKDRAAKRSGRKTSEYKYDPRTNRATLK